MSVASCRRHWLRCRIGRWGLVRQAAFADDLRRDRIPELCRTRYFFPIGAVCTDGGAIPTVRHLVGRASRTRISGWDGRLLHHWTWHHWTWHHWRLHHRTLNHRALHHAGLDNRGLHHGALNHGCLHHWGLHDGSGAHSGLCEWCAHCIGLGPVRSWRWQWTNRHTSQRGCDAARTGIQNGLRTVGITIDN